MAKVETRKKKANRKQGKGERRSASGTGGAGPELGFSDFRERLELFFFREKKVLLFRDSGLISDLVKCFCLVCFLKP